MFFLNGFKVLLIGHRAKQKQTKTRAPILPNALIALRPDALHLFMCVLKPGFVKLIIIGQLNGYHASDGPFGVN